MSVFSGLYFSNCKIFAKLTKVFQLQVAIQKAIFHKSFSVKNNFSFKSSFSSNSFLYFSSIKLFTFAKKISLSLKKLSK